MESKDNHMYIPRLRTERCRARTRSRTRLAYVARSTASMLYIRIPKKIEPSMSSNMQSRWERYIHMDIKAMDGYGVNSVCGRSDVDPSQ